MLETLWPESLKGHRCIVGVKDGVVKHRWASDNEAAREIANELHASGHDVYFAPFIFDSQHVQTLQQKTNPRTGRPYSGRAAEAASAARSLWLDIDCGEGKDYATQAEAAQALSQWLTKHQVPHPTYFVSSGYGLHVYWVLDQAYSRREWLPVAQHLKQAAALHHLRCDPVRTADAASLLRVPGTANHKRGEAAAVTVLADTGREVGLETMRRALPSVGPIGAVPNNTRVASEWDIPTDFPPADGHKINDRCKQLGMVAFKGGEVAEPLWRAALSVWYRCEDGQSLIHTLSQGDARYDAAETNEKAANTAGPATCAYFSTVNPHGCEGCPFAGKVTSPISLGVAEGRREPDPETGETCYGDVKVRGHQVNDQGVWIDAAVEGEPPVQICELPVWIEELRNVARRGDERGSVTIRLAWQDVHGKRQSGLLNAGELYDERLFKRWLADHHLAPFVTRMKHFPQFISRLNAETMRKKGERTVYRRLGWFDEDRLFVLGDKGIRENGPVDVVVENANNISQLSPRGDAEAWRKAVSRLDRTEYAAHAFAVLAAFGAPLLHLTGRDGAVVALVGSSGFGKTLAARTGLSVFAQPELVMEAGNSTLNALEARFASHQHVPVLVDEVTTMPVHHLADLIYMAANGHGKGRANINGESRKVRTWSTTTLLTSNHSIVDRAYSQIEEAHRKRLIELPVTTCLDQDTALALITAGKDNPGAAAMPYLQLVIQHQRRIPELFNVVERYVTRLLEASSTDRYVTWSLTSALLGGILAKVAGVLDIDPVATIRTVAGLIKQDYKEMPSSEERAFESLCEFLTTYSRNVCIWPSSGMGSLTDNPVARVTDERLYVRVSAIRQHWVDEHINMAAIKAWMAHHIKRRARVRLAPGTPPVDAYWFSMEKLGLTEAEIEAMGVEESQRPA